MTQPTIEAVQDRLYAIFGTVGNMTISGETIATKRFRTFPTNLDTANLPCLFSLQGPVISRNPATAGVQYAQVTRQYEIVAVVGDWNEGIVTETSQKRAEIFTDVVEDLLVSRPRLELDGGTPLDGVVSAVLGNDGGITAIYTRPNSAGFAGVRWPLAVTTRRSFLFEYSRP